MHNQELNVTEIPFQTKEHLRNEQNGQEGQTAAVKQENVRTLNSTYCCIDTSTTT
jgi:hypothetical protein